MPQIFDMVIDDGRETRVLNVEATEAAKEKLARIKAAFADWIWTDPDRTDRLARIYNDRFNNLVPRHFDGTPSALPGASSIIRLYDAPEAGHLAHRSPPARPTSRTRSAPGKPSPSPPRSWSRSGSA